MNVHAKLEFGSLRHKLGIRQISFDLSGWLIHLTGCKMAQLLPNCSVILVIGSTPHKLCSIIFENPRLQ